MTNFGAISCVLTFLIHFGHILSAPMSTITQVKSFDDLKSCDKNTDLIKVALSNEEDLVKNLCNQTEEKNDSVTLLCSSLIFKLDELCEKGKKGNAYYPAEV